MNMKQILDTVPCAMDNFELELWSTTHANVAYFSKLRLERVTDMRDISRARAPPNARGGVSIM